MTHLVPPCTVEDFPEGKREDASASVTLKDGTTRVGPWREGKPVGDWWKTHELIVGGSITQQAEQSALAVTSKKSTAVSTTSRTGAKPPQVSSLNDSHDNDERN